MLVTVVDVAMFPAISDWPVWAVELCATSELSAFPSSVNLEEFFRATPSATPLYSDCGKMV